MRESNLDVRHMSYISLDPSEWRSCVGLADLATAFALVTH